jgi:hypothetical protein
MKKKAALLRFFFKNRQIATENRLSAEGVARFMPAGYTFMSSLEKSRQLRRNLPRDACHSGSIRELKRNTLHQTLLTLL